MTMNEAEMDTFLGGREFFSRTMFVRHTRRDDDRLWVYAKPEANIRGIGLGDVLVLPVSAQVTPGDTVRWRRLVGASLDATGFYSVNGGDWRPDFDDSKGE